jgi:hypothetical protein
LTGFPEHFWDEKVTHFMIVFHSTSMLTYKQPSARFQGLEKRTRAENVCDLCPSAGGLSGLMSLRPLHRRGADESPSAIHSVREMLLQMASRHVDRYLLSSVYDIVASDDPRFAELFLNSGMFPVITETFHCCADDVCRYILEIFVEIARRIPTFTGFILSQIDHLATKFTIPSLHAPFFSLLAIVVSDEPSISTFLHSWNLLDTMNASLFETDKETLNAAAVLLYSMSERGCLLSDRCQDIGNCLNLCHFLVLTKGEATVECGLKIMNCLILNEVDPNDVFDTESIEIISKLFRSFRQMSGIVEVFRNLCRCCPSFADELFESTAIISTLKRFIAATSENIETVISCLIAVCELGDKWSQMILDYEILQVDVLPHFPTCKHSLKGKILNLFNVVGSNCPGAIGECGYFKKVLGEGLDFLGDKKVSAGFVISFLKMIDALVRIGLPLDEEFDVGQFIDELERLRIDCDHEDVVALSCSLLDALT